MNGRILSLVALMLAAPAVLQGQSPEERVEAAKARALAAGIPVSLLEAKLTEGQAKGVAMDRIAQALEIRLAVLSQARQALGGETVDEMELGLGAEALGSGVSYEVLEAIGEGAPQEHRAVAIAALIYLNDMGRVPEEALQTVLGAISGGPEGLAQLPGMAAEALEGRGFGPGQVGPQSIPGPGQPPASGRPGRPSGTPPDGGI